LKIIFECETFNSDKFFIQFPKNKYFPENGWYDFSVSIMTAWVNEVAHCERKNQADFRLYFMECDCELLCSKSGETVSIIALECGKATEILEYIDFAILKPTVFKAAKRMLNEAVEKNIWNDQLEKLRAALGDKNSF